MDVGPSGRLGLSHLSHLSPQGWYSKEGRAAHPPAWIQCVTYFSRSDLSFPLMFMRSWTFDIQTQATPYWKTAMYVINMFHTVSVQELLEWLLSACFCCFSTDMTERCCLIKSNCSAERDGAALAWVEKYLRSVIRLLSVLPPLLLRECLNWLFTRLRRIWRGSRRSSTMKRRMILGLALQTTYFQDWSGYYAG